MNFVIIDRVYWSPIDTSSNNRTLPISDPPPLNHQYQNSGQSRQGLILSSICQAIVLASNHLSFFHSSIKNPPQFITRYLCEGMSGARTQIYLCYWTVWRAQDVFIIPGACKCQREAKFGQKFKFRPGSDPKLQNENPLLVFNIQLKNA